MPEPIFSQLQNDVGATQTEDWLWSSAREHSVTLRAPVSVHPILSIDRVVLPADEETRI